MTLDPDGALKRAFVAELKSLRENSPSDSSKHFFLAAKSLLPTYGDEGESIGDFMSRVSALMKHRRKLEPTKEEARGKEPPTEDEPEVLNISEPQVQVEPGPSPERTVIQLDAFGEPAVSRRGRAPKIKDRFLVASEPMRRALERQKRRRG